MENDFSTESSQAISVGNTTSAPVKKSSALVMLRFYWL